MQKMLLVILVSLRLGSVFAEERSVTRPNVLFIAVDDLNDWIGCLGGHPQARSPNIDALAAKGTLFERAYCAAPACNPSRAALMTGIAPYQSGVYHNPDPWRRAMPKAVTLPQHFMSNGYHAWGCGKIYHGSQRDDASWEESLKRGGDPKPLDLPANGIRPKSHFDWGPVDVSDRRMSDYHTVDWAIKKLSHRYRKPFFLACGIFRPHLPWYVPKRYFANYPVDKIQLPKVKEDDLIDVPSAGVKMARPMGDHRKVTNAGQWKHAVQGYLASIEFADAQVGRLLDALARSPHADDTIVVLWGDHGWHLGEKHHWRKFSLWEEADRVPLIISIPAQSKGQRCGRTVSLMDLYPTLAELCSLPIGSHLAGTSLKRLLDNPAAEWERPAITTHGVNNHAIRTERWRYIRYADGTEELYDHNTDSMEWTNVASRPEFAKTKASLIRWLPKVNAAPVLRGTKSSSKKKSRKK